MSTSRWLASAALIALPAGVLTWVRMPAPTVESPLGKVHVDQALARLTAGEVQPSLAELSETELGTLAEILGRLLHSYQGGAFESFLALRENDLDFAAQARAGELCRVRGFVRELGGRDEGLEATDWVETLRRYWDAYYAEPPVSSFLFERAAIRWHREGLGARSLEHWQRTFEALRDREPGPTIQHELAIPHRRAIESVASDAGPLQWLDLELPFEASSGAHGRLIARFVWDAVHREWFLHAAATTYATGVRVERHLIL